MNKFNIFLKIFSIISIIALLNSCGALKPDWSKTAEPSGKKRARQNVLEGKGVIFDLNSKKVAVETFYLHLPILFGELH